jgi:hypothetical protein
MYGVEADPLAKFGPCDSVLFAPTDDRYAIVDLTWSRAAEKPPWSSAEIFNGLASTVASMAEHGG